MYCKKNKGKRDMYDENLLRKWFFNFQLRKNTKLKKKYNKLQNKANLKRNNTKLRQHTKLKK